LIDIYLKQNKMAMISRKRGTESLGMNRKLGTFQRVAPLFLLFTISFISPAIAEKPLEVTVSILPQKYFVEKIGGDGVEVSVMVLPGSNPATYEPKPRQMVNLTQSRIYFAIGVPFETVWLEKFAHANPGMKIVHTQAGIKKIPMKGKHDQHGNGDHGSTAVHSGLRDPHIWLSPPLVLLQARNILDALLKADPTHKDAYEANYREFIVEVMDLDLKIIGLFADGGPDKRFMVYHPAWGYFARAYGLEQISVEMEGKEPSPKELQQLIRNAKKDGITVIFVQPQFSTKSADTVARAIGGRVIFADPLALDWKRNLFQVARQFKAALK